MNIWIIVLIVLAAIAVLVVSFLIGRWIYIDSAGYTGKKWKRILLALQGLNSNGLITYLLMRRKEKEKNTK